MHKHQAFYEIIIIIYVNYSISQQYIMLKMTTRGADVIPYIKMYHCQFSEAKSTHIWHHNFAKDSDVG